MAFIFTRNRVIAPFAYHKESFNTAHLLVKLSGMLSMESSLYKGSHKKLFEAFLKLVDDSATQTAAILNLASWNEVNTLLSIGGGQGLVEASLLQNAPNARIWYLDPSPEQCAAFREHLSRENLLERIENVTETTFQAYKTHQKFDRILSIFSWYFMGANERLLTKLLNLLTPAGIAFIVLPNSESIFADFTRNMSPDKQMTLVGDEVMDVLETMNCLAVQHTYTKWLAVNDLFDGKHASEASLAFAGFVAMRPITAFSPTEKQEIVNLLTARREAKGVPLKWDLIIVKPG